MPNYEKKAVEKVGCTWKDAKEMIQEAKESLGIEQVDDDNFEKEILPKVAELWEKRKPTPEEIEAKQRAKEAKERKEEDKREIEDQERRKKNDRDFVHTVLCCCSCGLSLWCTTGVCKKDKPEEDAN